MSRRAGKDKIGLWLTISDFQCTPEDITTLLQLEPTRSSALRTKTRVPFWVKKSPVDQVGSDVELQWRGLQPFLVPLTTKLKPSPQAPSLEWTSASQPIATIPACFFRPTSSLLPRRSMPRSILTYIAWKKSRKMIISQGSNRTPLRLTARQSSVGHLQGHLNDGILAVDFMAK